MESMFELRTFGVDAMLNQYKIFQYGKYIL
jgi:hypothetical protein